MRIKKVYYSKQLINIGIMGYIPRGVLTYGKFYLMNSIFIPLRKEKNMEQSLVHQKFPTYFLNSHFQKV